jgi:chemotaxis protein methyltransferase CheR
MNCRAQPDISSSATFNSMTKTEDIELRLLLEAVYHKFHYDFRGYAMASIKRRLSQAREYFGCRSFSALQDRLLHEPDIFPQLFSYFTVQVSELFRDPSYFKAIREQVVPHLKTYPSLKVWIAGCSTGEEVYSLAILFREEGLEERSLIYATDINTEAIAKAEAGIYDLERISRFTDNYQQSGSKTSLSDYYTAAYGRAIFDRSLSRRVVFSNHSLATDAVFAEVQLISCRNVLIYFDRPLQDRAVGLFKDSLTRKAFLGVGAKETVRFTSHAGAFDEFLPKARIYQKRSE